MLGQDPWASDCDRLSTSLASFFSLHDSAVEFGSLDKSKNVRRLWAKRAHRCCYCHCKDNHAKQGYVTGARVCVCLCVCVYQRLVM